MKKILSILMILVLVSGAAFAQLTVTPSGSATLSWGIDLNTKNHGFFNEQAFKITIPFFAETPFNGGSNNKEADVYADVSFVVTPVASEEVAATDGEATLHFYGAYMTVYPKPDFSAKMAKGWTSIIGGRKSWFNPSFTGWGTKIGYANKDLMNLNLGLKLGSDGNWKGIRSDGKAVDTTNTDPTKIVPPAHSQYAAGFDFKMTPVEKYLTVEATVNAVFDKKEYKTNPLGRMMNFGLGLTSMPIDKLTIKAGFDGAAVDGFAWDASLSAMYRWVDAVIYLAGKNTEYAAGSSPINMAAHLAFNSKESGDTNFVPNLAFGVAFNAYDLLDKQAANYIIPMGFKTNVSYKIDVTDSMWLKPYANLYGETNNNAVKGGKPGFALAYDLGVIYQPIEKVEVKAVWAHGQKNSRTFEGGFFNPNPTSGDYMIKSPVGVDKGTLVFSLTLKY